MDLKTLKTFQTIVQLGSFQAAADQLQYVQSSITLHIQRLESDLGMKLLERGKKVKLTEAGRLLYDRASVLLKDFDLLQATMNEWAQGDAGIVRLGVMEPTASLRLPPILATFRAQHPKVQLKLQISSTFMLNQMLQEDKIEFVICTTPETGEGMTFEPLFTEELVLLLPEGNELALKDSIYMQDLQDQHLLLTTSLCPFRKSLENRLLECSVTPQYGTEISMMSALQYYVQSNLGMAVVPQISVTPPPKGTVVKPIVDLNAGLVTGILRKMDGPPLGVAGSKLIEAIRKGLKRDPVSKGIGKEAADVIYS
ncbi:LysR family transcriptional regulator [Paenibacillus xylaniclasticus]|uniref:LysR substrate-binding domain-containing protein n=1 Tax=Paenibacillus xylaniclasticus TaxID=588083 RepID=UPI000FD8B592|nr:MULTISPECIES: LysR family transcriptional regulator [Paenibacillus]GFN31430.1 LysR family transcriptional regulator [Paenibacillus curdlanolyticus]